MYDAGMVTNGGVRAGVCVHENPFEYYPARIERKLDRASNALGDIYSGADRRVRRLNAARYPFGPACRVKSVPKYAKMVDRVTANTFEYVRVQKPLEIARRQK